MPGPDAPAPLTADSLLGGRYRLVHPVANGGMAAVWEGHDEVLARPVAIKVLHPHLAADGTFQERFRREAIAAARLSHPNVVATFDAGTTANGTAYIVMELVRGTTLRQFLAWHGRLPPGLAVGIGIQIAEALGHAHRAGLVHRDIKPANVLLCDSDAGTLPRVKVTDFGIAKAAEGLGLDLTRTGTVLGTPKYTSPEQVAGGEPDARADLYSLGVVLFEMLAGVPPFVAPTDMALAMAHLHDPPPRLAAQYPWVPPVLDRLVAALLAKDPAARPPSAGAVRQALASIDTTGPAATAARGRDATIALDPAPTPNGRGPSGAGAGSGAATATRWPGPPTPNGTMVVGPVQPGGAGPGGAGPWPTGPGAPSTGSGPWPTGAGAGSWPTPDVGPSHRRQARSRPHSPWPGRVVGFLVVAVAAVVVAVVAFGPGTGLSTHSARAGGAATNSPLATPTIKDVSVFHLERNADNAATVGLSHDGNPETMWMTDHYYGPNFAGYRHGLGLAITLSSVARLHRLQVTSPTRGWSAEVYVARSPPTQVSLQPWGQPVDTKKGIDGSVSFDLGGREGGAVLLWITDLGPANRAAVAELAVS